MQTLSAKASHGCVSGEAGEVVDGQVALAVAPDAREERERGEGREARRPSR